MNFDEPRALISPARAAEILSMSIKTLREFVNAGKIPIIVTGRGEKKKRYAFDPADLAAFQRAQREIRGGKCQSTSRRARRSTSMTSSSTVFDFQALRAQLRDERPRK